MSNGHHCIACKRECKILPTGDGNWGQVCSQCGSLLVTPEADAHIAALREAERMVLAGMLRRRAEGERCKVLQLTPQLTNALISRAPVLLTAASVMEELLIWIGKMAADTRSFVAPAAVPSDVYIDLLAPSADSVRGALKELRDRGFLRITGDNTPEPKVEVSWSGWDLIERLKSSRPGSWRAFVAMSFDPSLKDLFKDAIMPALTARGYTAIRVDSIEHNGKIDDQIIAELRRCSLVVADVTPHRQGVYFGAGYGMGPGVPVVWSCREDEMQGAHFDTRQYAHVITEDTRGTSNQAGS
jgi:hypothetical protein